MIAQKLRLLNDLVSVAVAPFAGEGFVIAEKMEIQDVDYVPYFAAVVIDGRTG